MQLLKENRNTILLLAIAPVLFFKNFLFLFVLAIYLLIAYINRERLKKIRHQIIILYILHCLMLQLADSKFFMATENETYRFFLSFIASTIVAIIPFAVIFNFSKACFEIITPKEKKYAKLICTQHLTRTRPLFFEGGEIRIVCRVNDNCSNHRKLRYADKLVGVIGKTVKKHAKNKNYYVNLWNHSKKVVKDGDYDVIEVYPTAKINDYNSVLTQIMGYFYNDLKGFKPMDEVIVHIFGELNLTQSTRRLLEKNFKDVKYYKTP